MAQRISRAKATIAGSGGRFEMPPDAEVPDRLRRRAPCPLSGVQRGLHGLFRRRPPAARACRRGDPPHPRRPSATPGRRPRSPGLLALMLLTDARRPARTDGDGNLIPLADQDRSRWDRGCDRRGGRHDHGNAASRPDRPVPAPGGDRCRPRRGGDAPKTRTGARSSRYTGCSSASPPTRWSR